MLKKKISAVIANAFILLAILSIISCQSGDPKADAGYVNKIETWHKNRIASLTKPDGWLSLAGLFWLKEGRNTFGSASTNDIRFPEGKAPDTIGSFFLENGKVTVQIKSGVEVLENGSPVKSATLRNDAEGSPTILSWNTLSWFIIKRGDQYGVRLRDSDNPPLKNFKGIDLFPIDSHWRIQARFEPYDSARTIAVPTVLGTINEEHSPGALVFEIKGKTYRLDPVVEPGEDQYFVIFADQTNGAETYGAGRFLLVNKPDKDGTTIIDFNMAYNPPCAFTPYATCPMPPDQNRLPVRITAGEKAYQGAGHE